MTLGKADNTPRGRAQALGEAAPQLRVPLPHEELAAHRQRRLRHPGPAAEHPPFLPHPRHVQSLLPGQLADRADQQGHVREHAREDEGEAAARWSPPSTPRPSRPTWRGTPACTRVICDAEINRVWVAEDPKKSRIVYLAPCGRAVRRLNQYGIPNERIWLTGFPIPTELLGDRNLSVLKWDFGQRLHYLDPEQRFWPLHGRNVEHFLGKQELPLRPREGAHHHLRRGRGGSADRHRLRHREEPAREAREGRGVPATSSRGSGRRSSSTSRT